ncbi:hypothetical protein [Mammaliicoccus sciuri]|nr:hypothetical protein [Mammaliicoccus sciuri]
MKKIISILIKIIVAIISILFAGFIRSTTKSIVGMIKNKKLNTRKVNG